MGVRSRRPPLERTQNDADQVKYLVRHAEELDRNEILGWSGVEFTIPAGELFVAARHGLGRAYKFAMLAGVNDSSAIVLPATPDVVTASGYDTKIYVGVGLNAASASDVIVRLVVF